MSWIYLLVAGLFEIGFATLLKLSDGFTRLWATLGLLALGALSMGFLSLAMRTIPLGTAYAVWTGIGAIGTALVGILFFRDPATVWRLIFLALLLVGVCGLHGVSRHEASVPAGADRGNLPD